MVETSRLEPFRIRPQGTILWPIFFHVSLATLKVQVSNCGWGGKEPSQTLCEEKQGDRDSDFWTQAGYSVVFTLRKSISLYTDEKGPFPFVRYSPIDD